MTVKETTDQVIADAKCLVCESPAVWLRQEDGRIAVQCRNLNCHWVFGWRFSETDLSQYIDDKILSAEIIEYQ